MFHICSLERMERIEPERLASVLASMSTSTIAGLLCADQDYKVRAADRVARHIVTRLASARMPDRDQLALPF